MKISKRERENTLIAGKPARKSIPKPKPALSDEEHDQYLRILQKLFEEYSSRRELAMALDVDRGYVSRWLSGTQRISRNGAKKIADLLARKNKKITDLLARRNDND